MSESNGRILTLNNGRSPAKKGGDFITRAQAEQMVMAEREENERMVKWYMEQLPGLVAHVVSTMMAQVCDANGLVMQGPKEPETPAGMGDVPPPQSGDAAAPESPSDAVIDAVIDAAIQRQMDQ